MGEITHAAVWRKLGGSPDAPPPRKVQIVGSATPHLRQGGTDEQRPGVRIGFHQWEDAEEQPSFTEKLSTLLDPRRPGRQPPYGPALTWGVRFRGAKARRVAHEA